MAHLLADETLADILTRHLHVNDEAFAFRGPYAVASDDGWCSSSQVLLVCKRWLRVATPLLYDVIILRSAAQAQSLALALKKTPQLGAFIRKVRLEGGFGANVQKILALAPKVTDLVLNLTLWSNDSTTGICKALPSMNPRNLVLVHLGTEDRRRNRARNQENKYESSLRTALEAVLAKWTNLTRVTLEDSRLCGEHGRLPPMGKFLLDAPNLQEVHLWLSWRAGGRHAHITPLATRPRILRVVLHTCKEDYDYGPTAARDVLEQVCQTHPKAAEKIFIEEHSQRRSVALSSFELRRQFAIEVPKRITKPEHADFAPLKNAAPEVQERIWTLILSDAVHDEFLKFRNPNLYGSFDPCDSLPEDDLVDEQAVRYAANYMYVCKRFLRIVRRLVCQHLRLKTRTALAQAAAVLSGDPTLPPLVETVQIGGGLLDLSDDLYDFGGYGESDFVCGRLGVAEQNAVISILSSATRLRGLTVFGYLPLAAWQALSTTVTAIKTECESHTDAPTLKGNTFAPFGALKVLDWSDPRTEFTASGEPGELPQLETLILRSQTTSFLDLLSRMRLPALRLLEWRSMEKLHFTLERSLQGFCKVHGKRLTSLYIAAEMPLFVFELCPNLTQLELSRADLKIHGKHDKLAMIKVNARFLGTDTSEWKEFFDGFALSSFPALREFHIREPHLEKWPTDEHALAKFPWTVWGELLLTHGVQLMHPLAGPWKPRLKSVKQKRNNAGTGGRE